ncbi:hypothetical protein ACHAQH_003323 [Verticillium albo-atrum]
MRAGTVAAALAGLARLVTGHASSSEGQSKPDLGEGRDALRGLRVSRRQAMDRRNVASAPDSEVNETATAAVLEKRQGGRCGIEYGPSCDANIRPSGPETKNVPRPKVGSVPYGTSIRHCTRPGDIALTFDDGPFIYTDDLLDKLKNYDAKATFFVTGNNLGKGQINDHNTAWPGLLRRMIAEGHQIASHTWSHQRLTTITESKFRNQMHYLEIALADLFGYFPTYMRPPYSSCDAACETLLDELGYHITYFDLDTEGYLRNSPSDIRVSKDIWDAAVEDADPATTKYLQIEHDPVQQTVYNLTDYILASLERNGFRAVTVGECVGDPKANWYRTVGDPDTPSTTRTTSVAQPSDTLSATTNGRCGVNQGRQTCARRVRDMFRVRLGFRDWDRDQHERTDEHCPPSDD